MSAAEMDPAIDVTVRAALALLFLVAASHKLRDLRGFGATLAEYRVLPAPIVPGAAPVVAAAELALAAVLAVGAALRGPALLSAAVLLLLYAAAIALNLARGRRDLDCGCAGPGARRPIGAWMVARNGVLAAVALAAMLPVRARPLVWVDAITIAGATAALGALYASIDRLLADAPRLARLRSVA
jgi:uncharacterized membrane protein YphA (DoxX/SURF4 family)